MEIIKSAMRSYDANYRLTDLACLALGRIIQRTTDVETDYTYDPLGRLSQESNPLGTFRYDYLGDTNQLTARGLTTPSGSPGLALTADYDSNLGDRQLRRLTYHAGEQPLTAMLVEADPKLTHFSA